AEGVDPSVGGVLQDRGRSRRREPGRRRPRRARPALRPRERPRRRVPLPLPRDARVRRAALIVPAVSVPPSWAASPAAAASRIAPLVTDREDAPGGLRLGRPRIEDDLAGGVRRIVAFRFAAVDAPLRAAEAAIEIETGEGASHVYAARIDRLARGADL